jgi:hypothetical protein
VVVFLPLYMAFVLVVYVVMFGVMYHLWRDIRRRLRRPRPPVWRPEAASGGGIRENSRPPRASGIIRAL